MANLPTKVITQVAKRIERYTMDKGEKDITA